MSHTDEKIDQAGKAMVDMEGKYLTFTLAEEEYGIVLGSEELSLLSDAA